MASTPPPAQSPGFLLWRVSNAWQRAVRNALEPSGLTHAQFVILATLEWLGGEQGAKQHEVATLAGMDPMTTSQVTRVLEERDLVRREGHPEDGRAFSVALTPKGRKAVARAVPAVAEAESRFFEACGRHQRSLVAGLGNLLG